MGPVLAFNAIAHCQRWPMSWQRLLPSATPPPFRMSMFRVSILQVEWAAREQAFALRALELAIDGPVLGAIDAEV